MNDAPTVDWDCRDPARSYALLTRQLIVLTRGEEDPLAAIANGIALLAQTLPEVNWVGLYRAKGETLHVGPFQGAVACSRIAFGKGVCGDAAKQRRTILVPDVDVYPGHIVCDPRARSEIVLPWESRGRLLGVLDLDAPRYERFLEVDRRGLEALSQAWLEVLDPLLDHPEARGLFPALAD